MFHPRVQGIRNPLLCPQCNQTVSRVPGPQSPLPLITGLPKAIGDCPWLAGYLLYGSNCLVIGHLGSVSHVVNDFLRKKS